MCNRDLQSKVISQSEIPGTKENFIYLFIQQDAEWQLGSSLGYSVEAGVSSNQLPHIGNMRTDFQKSTLQSWCEYQGKEQLEIHIMLTE